MNEREVCVGTRDEAKGTFNALLDYETTLYKLVYIRGGFCDKKWGCSGSAQTMAIANSNREIITRPMGEVQYRFNMDSDEMFIKGVHPVMIKANDELNVWFIVDYNDSADENNYSTDDEICVDVYAYGKIILFLLCINF